MQIFTELANYPTDKPSLYKKFKLMFANKHVAIDFGNGNDRTVEVVSKILDGKIYIISSREL